FTPDEIRAANPILTCTFCRAIGEVGPHGVELSSEESNPVDYRCPSCDAVFTPDEIRGARPTVACTFCKATAVMGPHCLERPPPPPPVPATFYRGTRDHRCPGCQAVFTPDEVRRAAPTLVCTFCKLTVLMRPPPPPEPPPATPEPPPPATPAPT